MHRELILAAFEKAKEKEVKRGYSDPSKSGLANLLSDFIESEYQFQFGERSLRDYLNQALAGNPVEIKQPTVLDGLSRYLGYSNYTDYLLKNTAESLDPSIEEKEKSEYSSSLKPFLKRNKMTLGVITVAILLVVSISIFSKPKWMEWDGTHYIETSFDADKLKAGVLKPYKKDRIDDFELIEPTCETQFFNEDKSVRLWYGKNSGGQWEFFSSYGLHPNTGKTLKPITQYIVDKYICN